MKNRLSDSNKQVIDEFADKLLKEGILFCLLYEQEEGNVVSVTNMHEYGKQGMVDMMEGFTLAATENIQDYLYDEDDLFDEEDDSEEEIDFGGDVSLN